MKPRDREPGQLAPDLTLRDTCPATSLCCGVGAMSGDDAGYNYDRYRQLLAEAADETKRLALINLLIEEKAKDRLADHLFRSRLSALDRSSPLSPGKSR